MNFIFEMLLPLLCGLALFLFGMDLMGDSLKKSAGSGLKTILGKMTSNPVKGFLLGLGHGPAVHVGHAVVEARCVEVHLGLIAHSGHS